MKSDKYSGMAGLDSTYKELKQIYIVAAGVLYARLDSTYKELKHKSRVS